MEDEATRVAVGVKVQLAFKRVGAVLGAVARLEQEMIVERVRAGLAVSGWRSPKPKGTRLGRPAWVDAEHCAGGKLFARTALARAARPW